MNLFDVDISDGVQAFSTPITEPGVPPQATTVPPSAATVGMRGFGARLVETTFERSFLKSGVYPRKTGYLSSRRLGAVLGYDQYEYAIPLETAGSCLAGIVEMVNTNGWGRSILTPPLIRFVSENDAYLSLTNGGARMYINIEDYVFYNDNFGRAANEPFNAVIDFLRNDEKCGGQNGSRMHWGKAGWPEIGCMDASAEYGEDWCHFGCAVRTLDPQNKFQSNTDVFRYELSNVLKHSTHVQIPEDKW